MSVSTAPMSRHCSVSSTPKQYFPVSWLISSKYLRSGSEVSSSTKRKAGMRSGALRDELLLLNELHVRKNVRGQLNRLWWRSGVSTQCLMLQAHT